MPRPTPGAGLRTELLRSDAAGLSWVPPNFKPKLIKLAIDGLQKLAENTGLFTYDVPTGVDSSGILAE